MSPTYNRHDIDRTLRAFIAAELLFAPDPERLASDASLSALGVLDSTSILELIAFIETAFDVVIPLEAITSETFDTVNNITATVMAELRSHPRADTGE